jgi:uncharacterized membrane protein YsdA (DUF1294 family)
MPRAKVAAPRAAPVARNVPLKWVIFVLLCLLPATGALRGLAVGIAVPALAYVAVSLVAFVVYRHDKRRAQGDGQRTPEKLLHLLELCGGWPGALLAQQVYRHKTRKVPFQLQFWLIVLLHQLFWADQLLLAGRYLARLLPF